MTNEKSEGNESATLIHVERSAVNGLLAAISRQVEKMDIIELASLRLQLEEFAKSSNEQKEDISSRELKVWETAKLGACASYKEIANAYLNKQVKHTHDARQMLEGIYKGYPWNIEVKLVTAQLKDLGFHEEAYLDEVWAKIQEMGYMPCYPGVGPELMLQLDNPLETETYYVVMDPINIRGVPMIFVLEFGCNSLSARNIRFKLSPENRVLFMY